MSDRADRSIFVVLCCLVVLVVAGVALLTWRQLHPDVPICVPSVAVDYRDDGTSVAGWYDANNDLVLVAAAEDEYPWCEEER